MEAENFILTLVIRKRRYHYEILYITSNHEEFAGVVARVVVELGRDIESLRGRNSAFEPREAERQVEGCLRVC